MAKPILTDGMKAMMQKRREAARAGGCGLDHAHWYNRDIGILLKWIKELEDAD